MKINRNFIDFIPINRFAILPKGIDDSADNWPLFVFSPLLLVFYNTGGPNEEIYS
jgi:hypothetical protein